MKPIAAVELPDLRMPITETTAVAIPPAMPVHNAHGASGRELSFSDMAERSREKGKGERGKGKGESKIPVRSILSSSVLGGLIPDRHPRENGDPGRPWIPASAGMRSIASTSLLTPHASRLTPLSSRLSPLAFSLAKRPVYDFRNVIGSSNKKQPD